MDTMDTMQIQKLKQWVILILLAAIFVLLSGCDLVPLHMRDQAKYEPFEKSSFFEDGLSARPVLAHTVARGNLRVDTHYYEGKIDGEFASSFPMEVTAEILERGQERYNIYCSPCHSRVGDGQGMVAQRGLETQPASFHTERLKMEPVGYYYDVITNGFGAMYSYASRIPVADRWAIVAYVRALQLSQDVNLDDAGIDINEIPEVVPAPDESEGE